MTIYESIKEFLFDGALTLWQSHAITIIVTSIIATLSASVMRTWILSVHLKEKEIQSKEQSMLSFRLVLSAVNHIINNVLNYFQIIKLDIENHGKIDSERMRLLEEGIREANKQVKILNEIQKPSDPESYSDIYPK